MILANLKTKITKNWRTIRINEGITEAALVVHGGTIMNIMETYALPEKAFYEWHVGNGCGYEVELEPEQWQKTAKKFRRVRKIDPSLE